MWVKGEGFRCTVMCFSGVFGELIQGNPLRVFPAVRVGVLHVTLPTQGETLMGFGVAVLSCLHRGADFEGAERRQCGPSCFSRILKPSQTPNCSNPEDLA